MDLDQIVRVYVKIRDARSAAAKEAKERDAEFKEKLGKLEAVLLNHLNTTHADSVKTSEGTFYAQEDLIPTGSDWEAFYAWVKEHDAFDALERRIKKTFIAEYIETNHGEIPPGVSIYRERVVRVRRS